MRAFLEAFALFGEAWVTALLLAALLPWCGLVLVARRQVFLGAAIGQAATGGLALALVLGLGEEATRGHEHSETLSLCFALGTGTLVAVLSLRALSARRSSLEAVTAWVFLSGGAAAVLLLSNAPYGMDHVRRLQLSSLLGVSPWDPWIAGGALLATIGCAVLLRDRVLLWALDPATAAALGFRVWRWDIAMGLWLGLLLGFAIHATGLLFAFGCAVLPVLVARELCRSLTALLWIVPLLGSASTGAGLYLAHVADLPPGQVAVAVQGALLPVAIGVRAIAWGRAR